MRARGECDGPLTVDIANAQTDAHGVYVLACDVASDTIAPDFDHSSIKIRRCPVAMARDVASTQIAAVAGAVESGSILSHLGIDRLSSGGYCAAGWLSRFRADYRKVEAHYRKQEKG